jgi:hypothetical protein
MAAEIIKTNGSKILIQLELDLNRDMLASEEAIQRGLTEAGILASEYLLSQFDTDGTPIEVGKEKEKYTSKGQYSKTYQCPYGEIKIFRHVYQSNKGGITYCPLDNDARIVNYSTPKFAKMVSQKYSWTGSENVQRDLRENHNRSISRTYIQDMGSAVGPIALTKPWKYTTGVAFSDVSSIGISLDGACMLLQDDGWRQAMVGSISLYDKEGERMHTTYLAQAPQYGKEKFYRDFKKEIDVTKKLYFGKTYVGVADGAADNWKFLRSVVDIQVLDYFHATEYLAKVSNAAFKGKSERKAWLEQSRHTLKHENGGAKLLLAEMKELMKKKITQIKKDEIQSSITYFTNHLEQMDYASYLSKNIPIGSGVIEAACKVIVKQRMCNSGMRWTEEGARNILTLRCFNETDRKWEKFWKKIAMMGI